MIEKSEIFELEVELPSSVLGERGKSLIGFDERYRKLSKGLLALIDRDRLSEWSKKQYGKTIPAVEVLLERYPLIILHGDVGTGKTATAESMSNRLASDLNRDGYLFKLSTRVRGSGTVGQMSVLINQAFDIAIKEAGKSKLSFLIIDEADSLAANRDGDHSHHEDKVGVNTLIQRIDDVRSLKGRLLVYLCTNRLNALDPAIVRRAANIEEFSRPDETQREELFSRDLDGIGLTPTEIKKLVKLTGPKNGQPFGMTFSDLRTRLIPEAVARAFPDRKIIFDDFTSILETIKPSPPTSEYAGNKSN